VRGSVDRVSRNSTGTGFRRRHFDVSKTYDRNRCESRSFADQPYGQSSLWNDSVFWAELQQYIANQRSCGHDHQFNICVCNSAARRIPHYPVGASATQVGSARIKSRRKQHDPGSDVASLVQECTRRKFRRRVFLLPLKARRSDCMSSPLVIRARLEPFEPGFRYSIRQPPVPSRRPSRFSILDGSQTGLATSVDVLPGSQGDWIVNSLLTQNAYFI